MTKVGSVKSKSRKGFTHHTEGEVTTRQNKKAARTDKHYYHKPTPAGCTHKSGTANSRALGVKYSQCTRVYGHKGKHTMKAVR